MFPDLTRDDVFRIETARLWLRWPCARDAEAIATLAGDPAVAGMTAAIPLPLDRGTVDAFVIRNRRENAEGRALVLALSLREAPQGLVGLVAIAPDAEAAGPHLGYWLGRPHWGRGLMREAAGAMVEAYFAYARGAVLTSAALVENPASRRVLEGCGFTWQWRGERPFPARGGPRLCDLFRQDRAAWLARSHGAGCGADVFDGIVRAA